MYNLPMPISIIRTRIRQEFERHRYVSKLPVTDVLLFKSHAEYQVRHITEAGGNRANMRVGDDELLEADHARYVLFQGGELQGRQADAKLFHAGFPRGKSSWLDRLCDSRLMV